MRKQKEKKKKKTSTTDDCKEYKITTDILNISNLVVSMYETEDEKETEEEK